jgi:ribosomal protein S13
MNKSKTVIVSLISVLMVSCGSSAKLAKVELLELTKENELLKQENNSLKEQIIALDNALTESEKDEEVVFDLSPTINLKKEVPSVNSQLNELEAYLKKDAVLNSKFSSFKQGGIEKNLKVTYSDMQRVIKEAKTYKGTRHVMGGLSHSGIDCSGLLYVSFQANGITDIPRTAQDFARYGSVILNTNDIKAGDLVFFTNTYRTSKLVTHAGICIGNGEFIHTSSSKGVMVSKINDPYYWRKYFLFGTRIIN